MIFASRVPAPPLDRYIEHFWYYDDYQPTHTMEKLVPDGAVEIIIDLTEWPKRLHDPNDLSLHREFRGSWISGMRKEFLVIGADRDSSMMGVRFRPAGVGAFLDMPAREITEQVIDLDLVWGRPALLIRERLMAAPGPDARFGILEEFLSTRLRERFRPVPLVFAALGRLRRTTGPLRVRDVCEELGVSQKHLIELFDRSVGLKPKSMHRVFRFIHALESIEDARELDWAQLALECGYYDQPHFNREFKAFTGVTPTEYSEREGDLMFYIPLDPH